MSAFGKSVVAFATKFAQPQFYKSQHESLVSWVRECDKSGNAAKPFFAFMTAVGVAGYTWEYIAVGRHHATHKKAVIRKALAAEAH